MKKISGIIKDDEIKKIFVVTDDMLENQLRRESPKIAESFDKLCETELKSLSKLYSKINFYLFSGFIKVMRNKDELRQTLVFLLHNIINSFTAAIEILRVGFRLQPGILIRNILENISTVLHLFMYPEEVKNFKEGKLKSSKTIVTANKMIPLFGRIYGFFSKKFVHINSFYNKLEPPLPFTKNEDALEVNIGFIKFSIWLIYVTTELVFLDIVEKPRYWRTLGRKKYMYDPSQKELAWLKGFLEPLFK